MRKLMLLAAMVAMVLVAAAPAFAQNTITQVTDDDDLTINTLGNQATFIGVSQVQSGDANAAAVDDSTAEAWATNEADISVNQALAFGGVFFVDDGDLDDDGILDDFEFVLF